MNICKVLTVVAAASVLAACGPRESNEGASCVLPVRMSEAVSLKESVSSVHVIALQDSLATQFPGSVNKVVWSGDSIFVLDTWKAPGVYLYTSDGVPSASYTRKGNGPEEFVGLSDFEVTASEVVLLDTYSSAVRLHLDRRFSFLRKEAAEEQSAHAVSVGKGVWYDRGNVAYGENKDKLVYREGGQRQPVLPVPEELANVTFGSRHAFARVSADTVLYLPSVEPRLYKCYDGRAEVLCEFDFGGLWPEFSKMEGKDNPLSLMSSVAEGGKIYGTELFSDGTLLALSFFCRENLYVYLFSYPQLKAGGLLEVKKEDLSSLGSLVALTDGCLVFGEPGKLLKCRVKWPRPLLCMR